MTNLLHNEALKRGVNLSCMREDGIRDQPRSRGLGDVYKRQLLYDYTGVNLEREDSVTYVYSE